MSGDITWPGYMYMYVQSVFHVPTGDPRSCESDLRSAQRLYTDTVSGADEFGCRTMNVRALQVRVYDRPSSVATLYRCT